MTNVILRQPAIKYIHYIEVDNLAGAIELLKKYPERFTEYEIDNGAWRDYVSKESQGVEFPSQEEAILFMNYFSLKSNCKYSFRKPQG